MGTTGSNVAYKEVISAFNFDGETPLTGLTASDFSFAFIKDGSTYSSSVTTGVTDLGSGRYDISITFPSEGFWAALVEISVSSVLVETHQINVNVRDTSGDAVYSSSLAQSITMTQTVGGIASGTAVSSLSNGAKTVSQVLDQLLFPTAHPTTSNPSCSLGDNVANLHTVGSSIDITLSSSANRGTINTPWDPGSQGAFAGAVTGATIAGPGGPYTPGVSLSSVSVSGHVVTLGSNSWTLTVTFANGVDPLDSTGAVSTEVSSYSSGNKSNSTSFEGVYPIILGTSADAFANRSLVSHNANNIQLSQAYDETSSVRHRIKISNAMINSRAVTFQQWNPVSSAYADLGSGDFISSSVTETVEGIPVGYTMYTKAGALGGGDVGGQAIYRVRFD